MDYIATKDEAALIESALVFWLAKRYEGAEYVEQDRQRDYRQKTADIEKLLDRMKIANLYVTKERR